MNYGLRKFLFGLVLSFAVSANAWACIDWSDLVPREMLHAMITAPSLGALREVYAHRAFDDPTTKLVYAVLLVRRRAAEGDESVVAAIPKNPVEFWYAYNVLERQTTGEERELSGVYFQYWTDIVGAIIRTGHGHAAFLKLSGFVRSGEMADQLQAANDALWDGDRDSMQRAIRTLPSSLRLQICNSDDLPCDPAARPQRPSHHHGP